MIPLTDSGKFALALSMLGGYCLGSALKSADDFFEYKDKKVHGVENDNSITVKYQTDAFSELFYLLLNPFLPQNSKSSEDLFKVMKDKGGHNTKAQFVFGIFAFGVNASLLADMICKLDFAGSVASCLFLATTHLVSAFVRGNTKQGFWMNPIGCSIEKISDSFSALCEKIFGKRSEFSHNELNQGSIKAVLWQKIRNAYQGVKFPNAPYSVEEIKGFFEGDINNVEQALPYIVAAACHKALDIKYLLPKKLTEDVNLKDIYEKYQQPVLGLKRDAELDAQNQYIKAIIDQDQDQDQDQQSTSSEPARYSLSP